MNILDILSKKIKNKKLSKEEIDFFVKLCVSNQIEANKISAFLVATYINGMTNDEIYNLTISMTNSGEIYNVKSNNEILDKHSTGGVGDKVSIIICPLLASFGIPVAKMSGRGLGITGGTIDKLNSISVQTMFEKKKVQSLLHKYNFFIIEQSESIVPADKIFYSIRNDIAAVDSIPLITSSIMSKKLAINSKNIYLDVKMGEGAFFKNMKDAESFAKLAIKIGKQDNRNVCCYITDMSGPLGSTIGNKIEIFEAIEFLRGNFYSESLKKYLYDFISDVLIDYKKANSKKEAFQLIDMKINSLEAYKLLINYFNECGSKIEFSKWNDYETKFKHEIYASKSGYISWKIDRTYSDLVIDLKMGRTRKTDQIDNDAGIMIHKEENSKINKGDKILTIFSSSKISEKIIKNVMNMFALKKEKNPDKKKIIKIIK